MGVPPNHPFVDGFSIINNPFGGTPIYGNPHVCFSRVDYVSENPRETHVEDMYAERANIWIPSYLSLSSFRYQRPKRFPTFLIWIYL